MVKTEMCIEINLTQPIDCVSILITLRRVLSFPSAMFIGFMEPAVHEVTFIRGHFNNSVYV